MINRTASLSAKTQRAFPASLTTQIAADDDLLEQLAISWERGERRAVEYFLDLTPGLWQDTDAAVALVYEEYCIREELDLPVTTEEYYERFPEWRAELKQLFERHEPSERREPKPVFPAVGERLGEFQLLAELGKGALGQVYLASQPALGDRRVVLKVTLQRCDESLSLSRLQHTHIVPLYCALDDPHRNLSAFCMPYLGGTTLDRILRKLRPRPVQDRHGLQMLAILQGAEPVEVDRLSGAKLAGPETPPAQRRAGKTVDSEWGTSTFLSNASYTRAVAWIFACLAEALAYMHERGLVHMDLKPSNVLIAGDGQPMLIDFHLANEPLKAGATSAGNLGGTLYYMSPEQKQAVNAILDGKPIPADVDGRSDIYGLGLMMYEALTGQRPGFNEGARRPLRELNPDVSPGFSDIVDRCLATKPSSRYVDAASLASDLRRHLAHLPLRFSGNRSLAERWRKWRRRRPYGPTVLAMLLLLVIGGSGMGLFGWLHVQDRISLANSRLEEASRMDAAGNHDQALRALQEELQKTKRLPGTAVLRERLAAEIEVLRQRKLATRLSTCVDRLRMLEGIEAPVAELKELYSSCWEVWERRDQLNVARFTRDTRELNRSIRIDLLDMGILLAALRGRLTEDIAAHYEALAILDDTEALFGTSAALEVQRFHHAEAAGLAERGQAAERRAASLCPTTAWEHQALGRWLLSRGQYDLASNQFQSAIDLEPASLWPHFYRAACAQRLGNYSTAVNELNICVALSPERPECYYNRALALAALGEFEKASLDLGRALELSPDFAAAIRQARILSKSTTLLRQTD